jgi:hypothetical protein
MRVLGWIEGQDFIVMQSGIETGSRSPLDEAAQRVVANKPDLIFTTTTAYALAAQRATGSIPIVMLASGYGIIGDLLVGIVGAFNCRSSAAIRCFRTLSSTRFENLSLCSIRNFVSLLRADPST